MIRTIALREIRDHLRSFRFGALCALSILLLPLGAYVNASSYHERAAYAELLEQGRLIHRGAIETSNAMTGSRFGWRAENPIDDPALRAIRRPAAAAVLAAGLDGVLPAYWQFGTEGLFEGSPMTTSDARFATGPVDFEYVVEVVIGLLAILLAFDAISGERESGLLRMILAHPVARIELLLGKYLGGLTTLFIPLAIGGTLAAAGLAWLGMPILDREFWPRGVMFLLASVLYLSGMLALGLAVSAATRRSHTSLVVLLLAWIVIVLIVPRCAALAAQAMTTTTPDELVRQNRRDNVLLLERERARRLAGIWNAVSGADTIPSAAEVPAETRQQYDRARAPVEAELSRRKRGRIQDILGEQQRRQFQQRHYATLLGRIAPAVSFRLAASEIAGTGLLVEERWRDQTTRYQALLERETFDKVHGLELFNAQAGYTRSIWWPDQSNANDRVPSYDDLPDFTFVAPSVTEAILASTPDLALLLLANALWLSAACVIFVRADIQ